MATWEEVDLRKNCALTITKEFVHLGRDASSIIDAHSATSMDMGRIFVEKAKASSGRPQIQNNLSDNNNSSERWEKYEQQRHES